MKNRYIDHIKQNFGFPTTDFKLDNADLLTVNDIPLMDIIKQYGTPLKITYLPKISANIQRAKTWFNVAIAKANYTGKYHYAYCTKSSHFKFVLEEVLKNKVHLETSSAYDLNIIQKLDKESLVNKKSYIICNGFKSKEYISLIHNLVDKGFANCIPVLDNVEEIDDLIISENITLNIGIRIASEEGPKFEFYTSRLGIGYKDIIPLYMNKIKNLKNIKLKMLHTFINTGIEDTTYYWNELLKCITLYCELKKVCPTLDSLNIGGGFPIRRSLNTSFDYAYMAEEIVAHIKRVCASYNVPDPHLFTEFGSFTVGESGATIFSIVHQKRQNDCEKWNMIDGSFMTSLPDTWAINQRFIMLPINKWKNEYERVLLGGLTCDSDDYYNSEQHLNSIYLPKIDSGEPLYIGFFNTGAYQESLSGFGGIQHCLVPAPKHIIVDMDTKGVIHTKIFSKEQSYKSMLKVLGY